MCFAQLDTQIAEVSHWASFVDIIAFASVVRGSRGLEMDCHVTSKLENLIRCIIDRLGEVVSGPFWQDKQIETWTSLCLSAITELVKLECEVNKEVLSLSVNNVS